MERQYLDMTLMFNLITAESLTTLAENLVMIIPKTQVTSLEKKSTVTLINVHYGKRTLEKS